MIKWITIQNDCSQDTSLFLPNTQLFLSIVINILVTACYRTAYHNRLFRLPLIVGTYHHRNAQLRSIKTPVETQESNVQNNTLYMDEIKHFWKLYQSYWWHILEMFMFWWNAYQWHIISQSATSHIMSKYSSNNSLIYCLEYSCTEVCSFQTFTYFILFLLFLVPAFNLVIQYFHWIHTRTVWIYITSIPSVFYSMVILIQVFKKMLMIWINPLVSQL